MKIQDINKQIIILNINKVTLNYFKIVINNSIAHTEASIVLKNSSIPQKHLINILSNKKNLLNKLNKNKSDNFNLYIYECVVLLDVLQMDIIETIANYKLKILKDKKIIHDKINIFEKYFFFIHERKLDNNYFDIL